MANIKIPDIAKYDAMKTIVDNTSNLKFSQTSAAQVKDIPEEYSLRDKFSEPYDQGATKCSSTCAAIGCEDYYDFGPKSKWVPSLAFTYYNQHIVDKAEKPYGSGSSCVESALFAVNEYGVCDAKSYPNDSDFTKKPAKALYTKSLKGHQSSKYYNISSITQIKQAISAGYPVPFSMDWYNSFKLLSKNILSDPAEDDVYTHENGHSMIIVGYDDKKELVEVRNSWGPNWGDKGYCYIKYSTLIRTIWWDDTFAVIK